MKQVFLSYARLNGKLAHRLFNDLSDGGSVKVWFDREDLLPGMRWRPAIRKAIRESDFFVALFSREAVKKRGFRNSEIRHALDVMSEFPDDQIFLIPTRLDECEPPIQELGDLTYADLFPKWNEGIRQLRKAIGIRSAPTVSQSAKTAARSARPVAKPGHHYKVGLVDVGDKIAKLSDIAQGLSKAQRFFGFTVSHLAAPKSALLTIDGEKQLYIDGVSDRFYKRIAPLPVDFAVCMTDRYIAFDDAGKIVPTYIASESPVTERVQFISWALLPGYSAKAGVSLEAALAFVIAAQLVAHFLDMEYHPATRDCPMDFDYKLDDLIGALRKGRFCSDCSRRLKKNPELQAAVNALISWGR